MKFQSHAGSIEAWLLMAVGAVLMAGFNPTLVRLRPTDPASQGWGWLVFQSHAGSIEARDAVAVEGGKVKVVSIPRWFD